MWRFRNFLAVLPPPTLHKLETLKKFLDTGVQHCVWGEGRGSTWVNWKTPQKCKSLSMIVGLTMYLLLVSCVYRSNAHGSLPTDVPPAVNLSRVSQRKGPVQMQTCLWSTCKRFTEFQESFRNKPYEQQKDSLEVQLSSFIRSLVPPKKFSAAIAEDIVKFLISMDAAGKQNLHVRSCSSKTWSCPKRLVAGTVDSYIRKLRAIFNRLGRTGFSNPLAHPCVKEYLMFVREEQAQRPL